jgi:outer membrane protein W
MLRKLFALPVLGLAAAVLMPSAAKAQEYGFDAGNWELTLSGSGTNDRDFNGTSFGATGSLGYFFTDNLEVVLRQNITYTDVNTASGSAWNGSTDLALDWHFDLGRWQPFVGANIGYAYGDSTNDTWEAGPEAGVKYFITQSTFVQLMAQYEFFFDTGSNSFGRDSFSDGAFFYSLGLGVKL